MFLYFYVLYEANSTHMLLSERSVLVYVEVNMLSYVSVWEKMPLTVLQNMLLLFVEDKYLKTGRISSYHSLVLLSFR